jgi:hypothetical protein
MNNYEKEKEEMAKDLWIKLISLFEEKFGNYPTPQDLTLSRVVLEEFLKDIRKAEDEANKMISAKLH